MQINVNNTNPLPAGGQWISAWLQADPNYPFVTIEATSDQPGTLTVFEADQNDGQSAPISAHQIASLAIAGSGTAGVLNPSAAILSHQVRALFYRVVYTNGATAQALFNFNLWSSTIPVDSTTARKFDLMLRELRAHTHLLLWLKDPSGGLPPNLPMGFDLTQGDSIPAAANTSPSGAPIPTFD